MGAVWLTWDELRQQDVALKRAFDPRPNALLRFKREFRVIEQLRHPHLVRVFELGEDAEGLFFTMEVIDGEELDWWCQEDAPRSSASGTTELGATRPEAGSAGVALDTTLVTPTLDDRLLTPRSAPAVVSSRQTERTVQRLSQVLPQLLDALAFLHGHKIVHCDLKHSNVLVTSSGQLKVLDFGVLAQIGGRGSKRRSGFVGTVGYVSPEQISGQGPSPASDLYAMGVMLYEIVAGRPPFEAEKVHALLFKHVAEQPVPLVEIVPGVPKPLSAAVQQLLAKDPGDRPSLSEVAASLLTRPEATEIDLELKAARPRRLLGRDDERAGLRSAALDYLTRQRGSGVLVVQGPTGSGKTMLMEAVLADLEAMDYLILRGRARSAERVAFNALDAAIDDLAGWLDHVPADHRARLERDRVAAAAIFPVLMPKQARTAAGLDISRGQGFDGLIQLLEGVTGVPGAPPGVVVFSDDVQWADQDCVALMDQLVEAQRERVLLVATLRDDVGPSASGRWLGKLKDVTFVELAPLPPETIESIIRTTSPIPPTPSGLHRAIAACDGRPMLAELAGRLLAHASPQEEEGGMSLAPLFETLPDHARGVLCLVAAADSWVSRPELLAVSGQNPGQIDDLIDGFVRDGLVRRDGRPGDDRVDIYHDSIRAALAEAISAVEWSEAHRTHAEHQLEVDGPAERLVRHLLEAGQSRAAVPHARRAAAEAEQQRAYGLAAAMYAVALKHPGEDRLVLLEQYARALEQGARYDEAVRVWRTLAEAAEDEEDRTDAYLGEACALLACDRLEAGQEKLRAAMNRTGSGGAWSGLAGLAAVVRFMMGPPRRSGRKRTITPNAKRRAQRDVRVGMMILYSEPLAGVRYLRRAQARFAAAGLAAEVAKSDFLFAYFILNGSAKPGEIRLCERYMSHGRQIVESLDGPGGMVSVYARFIDAVKLQRNGQLVQADEALGAVMEQMEAEGAYGTFEHLFAAAHRCNVRIQRQQPRLLVQAIDTMRRAIREATDSALRSHFAMSEMLAALFQGNAELALEISVETRRAFPAALPTHQELHFGLFAFWPELYLTDCRGLSAQLHTLIRRTRRFRPYNLWTTGFMCSMAALLEANALRTGDAEASPARIAKLARRADKCVPITPGMSWRARAYAADAVGRAEEALAHLEQAEAAAERAGQPIDLAIARYQRGRRLGGDEGDALIAAARRALVEIGAAERMLEEDVGLRG